MLKVKGKEFLRREEGSKAIVNVDSNGFRAAKAAKTRILSDQQKIETLESRLNQIEKRLGDLLDE